MKKMLPFICIIILIVVVSLFAISRTLIKNNNTTSQNESNLYKNENLDTENQNEMSQRIFEECDDFVLVSLGNREYDENHEAYTSCSYKINLPADAIIARGQGWYTNENNKVTQYVFSHDKVSFADGISNVEVFEDFTLWYKAADSKYYDLIVDSVSETALNAMKYVEETEKIELHEENGYYWQEQTKDHFKIYVPSASGSESNLEITVTIQDGAGNVIEIKNSKEFAKSVFELLSN